jgi:hypothetical protein
VKTVTPGFSRVNAITRSRRRRSRWPLALGRYGVAARLGGRRVGKALCGGGTLTQPDCAGRPKLDSHGWPAWRAEVAGDTARSFDDGIRDRALAAAS